jgi:hypothetical protein
MTGLRDAAAVLLTWCGYGLAWGTARLLSREPARRGRRVLYEAPWTPPAPPHLVPDVRNAREAPVPVPPPAPPVLLRSGQRPPAGPARPQPVPSQTAAGDRTEVTR